MALVSFWCVLEFANTNGLPRAAGAQGCKPVTVKGDQAPRMCGLAFISHSGGDLSMGDSGENCAGSSPRDEAVQDPSRALR